MSESNGVGNGEDSGTPQLDPSELPFLVTHWLSNYRRQRQSNLTGNNSEEALQRLQTAANEVASAFADLGVFGSFHEVSS